MPDVFKISADIEAKLDRLDVNLKQAESKVKAAADRMAKSSVFKLGLQVAKGFLAVAGGAKVASGAANILRGITSAIRGDVEGVQMAMEALPFAIGAAAVAGREFGEAIADALFDMKATAKALDESLRRLARSRQAGQILAPLRQQRRIAEEADPFERARIQVRGRAEQVRERARDLRPANFALVEKELELITTARLEAIDRQEEKFANKQRARDEKTAKERLRRDMDAIRDRGLRLESLQTRIEARRLELAGKTEQARIKLIKQSFDEQIALSKDAAEKELLARLRAVELQAAAGRARVEQIVLSRAILGGGGAAAQATIREVKVEKQDQILDKLERIATNTGKGSVALVGG